MKTSSKYCTKVMCSNMQGMRKHYQFIQDMYTDYLVLKDRKYFFNESYAFIIIKHLILMMIIIITIIYI